MRKNAPIMEAVIPTANSQGALAQKSGNNNLSLNVSNMENTLVHKTYGKGLAYLLAT